MSQSCKTNPNKANFKIQTPKGARRKTDVGTPRATTRSTQIGNSFLSPGMFFQNADDSRLSWRSDPFSTLRNLCAYKHLSVPQRSVMQTLAQQLLLYLQVSFIRDCSMNVSVSTIGDMFGQAATPASALPRPMPPRGVRSLRRLRRKGKHRPIPPNRQHSTVIRLKSVIRVKSEEIQPTKDAKTSTR